MREQFDLELQVLEQTFLDMGHSVLEAASKSFVGFSSQGYGDG